MQECKEDAFFASVFAFSRDNLIKYADCIIQNSVGKAYAVWPRTDPGQVEMYMVAHELQAWVNSPVWKSLQGKKLNKSLGVQ